MFVPAPKGGPVSRPYVVSASSISLASALRRMLAHFAALPLPTKPASLGFGGGPIVFRRGRTLGGPPRADGDIGPYG